MIVWRGWGILVIVIAALSQGLVQLIGQSLDLQENILVLIGFLLAAPIIWWLGKRFNQPKEQVYIVNKETGVAVEYTPQHSLFWIKMEYWAIILPAIGVIALFAG